MIEQPELGLMDSLTKHLSQLLSWSWLLLIALWGGTANYVSRIRKNEIPFSVVELIGEWSISGFAGVVTALIAVEAGWSFYMTAAVAGIAGHMGGRAIGLIEYWVIRRAKGGN